MKPVLLASALSVLPVLAAAHIPQIATVADMQGTSVVRIALTQPVDVRLPVGLACTMPAPDAVIVMACVGG